MLRVAVVAAILLTPFAVADSETGSGLGFDLGLVKVGQWQSYNWTVTAGTRTLDLSWAASSAPFPWADYDLRLYEIGAAADNVYLDEEMLAESDAHPGAPHTEQIVYALPVSGVYDVVVIPWQAQDETFTLTSSAGTLAFLGQSPGAEVGTE